MDFNWYFCTLRSLLVYVEFSCSGTNEMFFSRPLSLFTLISAFAIDASVAKGSNDNDSEVTFAEIFAVDYPIVAYIHDSVCSSHLTCSSNKILISMKVS